MPKFRRTTTIPENAKEFAIETAWAALPKQTGKRRALFASVSKTVFESCLNQTMASDVSGTMSASAMFTFSDKVFLADPTTVDDLETGLQGIDLAK